MIKALRGTKDILPGESDLWQFIESTGRDIFNIYGYNEIRTPIIEEASLFIRGIGDLTDIVQKEMYVFSDRGNRRVALRPEATASIVRAYIENSMSQSGGAAKLFYTGPMFRSERPQQGRQRQFYQIGVEAIGSDSPFLDAEVIALAVRFLDRLGVKNYHVKLNSLGCQKDKMAAIAKHKENFKPHFEKLCDTCKARFDKNVLRIFDCKGDTCRVIAENVKVEAALCNDCESHFKKVKQCLDELGVKYTVDHKIVRGLDYYTKTVFEITQDDLGAKDAICAGGRYNNLVKELGGKDTPATGFAFGVERLALALKAVSCQHSAVSPKVFVAVAGEGLYPEAFKLLDSLRGAGIASEMDYDERSLKSQMRKAEKLGAGFVVILGEDEFKKGKAVLKDMSSGDQKEIMLNEIISALHTIKTSQVAEGNLRS
ncbi:MAG: histidine--tRNA ligase [Candidatus Omnitrophota bacterium]|nr:histidine--tRNA ligase [Candidatus Omnitrophota bacterium]